MQVQPSLRLPCTGCASTCQVFTGANGRFSDGSGPSNNYASLAWCQWIIAPSGATKNITIIFTEFSTEAFYDYVKLYSCSDIECKSAQILREMSGSYSSSQTVISSTGYMLVQLTSDSINSYPGFTATWSSMAASPAPTPSAPIPTPEAVCMHVCVDQHITIITHTYAQPETIAAVSYTHREIIFFITLRNKVCHL
jgi:hypothetical protein